MYFKLALRNAKRSAFDYLLYILTITILVSIICVSNCVSTFGSIHAGFETESLPILIVLIMVILTDYINTFMLKQRSKELAIYTLLGIGKNKLSLMFIFELCVIDVVCLVVGMVIGLGLYFVFFNRVQNNLTFSVVITSIIKTFAYFCLVEIISVFRIKQKIAKSQISQFMNEKHRNQPMSANKKLFWSILLLISFVGFLVLICIIAFFDNSIADMAISFISIPMLVCVFAFYKWMYAYFSSKRLSQSDDLYKGNYLYRIAEMTTSTKTSAIINGVFGVCLLFSATSFTFGIFMLNSNIQFSPTNQQWMGFLQISICIIFMVIYFSILSLMQIIELKKQAKNVRILYYMGKNQIELKDLVKSQVLMKLFIPTIMSFVLLGISTPLINYKINMIMPKEMHNVLLGIIGCFTICFICMYLCYFFVIYVISIRYIKNMVKYKG